MKQITSDLRKGTRKLHADRCSRSLGILFCLGCLERYAVRSFPYEISFFSGFGSLLCQSFEIFVHCFHCFVSNRGGSLVVVSYLIVYVYVVCALGAAGSDNQADRAYIGPVVDLTTGGD